MADEKLNDREQRFVAEYFIDMKPKQAALAAGYSKKNAARIAYQLLRKPKIIAALAALREDYDIEYRERIVGKYEILAKLTEIARGDIGDLLPTDETGKLSLAQAKKLGKSHLIKRYRRRVYEKDGVRIEEIEIEMHSALDALVDLAKHYGLFLPQVGTTVNNTTLVIVKKDE